MVFNLVFPTNFTEFKSMTTKQKVILLFIVLFILNCLYSCFKKTNFSSFGEMGSCSAPTGETIFSNSQNECCVSRDNEWNGVNCNVLNYMDNQIIQDNQGNQSDLSVMDTSTNLPLTPVEFPVNTI